MSAVDSVPKLDVQVDISSQDEVDKGAREVIARVRPEWSNVGIKVFSAGVTNKLVGAYDADSNDDKYDDMILIRCYGYKTDLLIDRGAEIRNMLLMHKEGMGAELMATFKNGIAYEFLKGQTLDPESVASPQIYPLVARAMKRLHDIELEGGPQQEACIWSLLRKFHDVSPDGFPEDPEKDAKYKAEVFSKGSSWVKLRRWRSC